MKCDNSISLSGRAATGLVAGGRHTCALLLGGGLACWGWNEFGQLGVGTTTNVGDNAGEMGDSLRAVDFGAGRSAVSLAVGGSHTCALLTGGKVACWGFNEDGQLGTGDNEDASTPKIVDLGAGGTAIAVVAGSLHTCALLATGPVLCWGYNGEGRLGIGSTDNVNTPQSVSVGAGRFVSALAAGGHHTCALLHAGSVLCWGQNMLGQLGAGHGEDVGGLPGQMGDRLKTVDLGAGDCPEHSAPGDLDRCTCFQGFWEGESSCNACAPGSFGAEPGASSCTACAAGTFNSETGSTLCTGCAAGTYGAAQGANSSAGCLPCSRGSFSSEGQSVCSPCEIGTYAADPGQSICDFCAPGAYGGAAGVSTCSECSTGSFSSSPGSLACVSGIRSESAPRPQANCFRRGAAHDATIEPFSPNGSCLSARSVERHATDDGSSAMLP